MRRPFILLVAFIAAGCAHVPTEPHSLFSEFAASDIAEVVLADDTSFGKGGLSLLPVVVTDRSVISEMYKACSTVPLWNGMSGPFIGILGHQVFLDSKSNVLAVVHIINYQSNVNFQRGYLEKGRVIGPRYEDSDYYWTSGESEAYCRIVYDIMKTRLPEEIESQNADYKRHTPPKTVEQMLFEKEQ